MVLDVVREMALAARMPVPTAYIIDDPSPNAFATGRDPAHSVVCVTQGLVDDMDREEMQGVLGHEMAHVRDYDIRTMTMIAVLIGGVALLSDFFFRYSLFGGFGGARRRGGDRDAGEAGAHNRDRGVHPGGARADLRAIARDGGVARARISGRRRLGRIHAQSTGAAAGAGAYRAGGNAAGERLARRRPSFHRESASGRGDDDEGGFFNNLLSTHPPLSKRIARLRALAGEAAPAPQTAGA